MESAALGARDTIVDQIVASVLREIDSPLTAEALVAKLGYSSRHARRVFLKARGEGLAAFIRRIRLERAAGRLSQEGKSVSAVAAEAQYVSPKAFSRAFHSHFECAPATFRELNEGPERLLPGFYLAAGAPVLGLPAEVGIVTARDALVTFQYDGMSLDAKIWPDGQVQRTRTG